MRNNVRGVLFMIFMMYLAVAVVGLLLLASCGGPHYERRVSSPTSPREFYLELRFDGRPDSRVAALRLKLDMMQHCEMLDYAVVRRRAARVWYVSARDETWAAAVFTCEGEGRLSQ